MGIRRALAISRRTVAIAVVVAVVACTAPSEDPAPRDEPSAEAAVPRTEDTPKAFAATGAEPSADVVTAVTSAGIRIVAADGSTAYGAVAPASGIDVTEEQLAGLVAESDARSGSLGATLDGMIPTDVPLSAFLVGYARGADTPAAHLASTMLEGQDLTHPDRVVFPALVPMLFAADLAHAAGDPDAVTLSPSAYSSGQLCSSISASITRGINAVFDALHVNYADMPKTGIGLLDSIIQGMADLVVDGVNIVVEAGRILVLGVEKFLIDQVLAVVAKVAAIASMVALFSGYVHKVNLKIDFGAESVWKGVEPTGNLVTATLTASTDYGYGAVDWPPEFADCAKEAGVPLTPLKPLGEHVRWTLEADPDLLRSSRPGTDTLGEGGPGLATATWDLVTGTEKPGLTGEGVEETATVRASVERTKVKELLQTVVAMAGHWLASPLPAFIRQPLEAAVTEGVGSLLKDFVKLMDLETSRRITIKYHSEDKKKKKETWDGTWDNPGYGSAGTFHMEVTRTSATMAGSLQVSGADCLSAGHFVADVNGDEVTFGLVSGGIDVITFSGKVRGDHVAGMWEAGPGCGGWTGPWEGTITRPKK
jgi:hypothetical protein